MPAVMTSLLITLIMSGLRFPSYFSLGAEQEEGEECLHYLLFSLPLQFWEYCIITYQIGLPFWASSGHHA